MNCNKCGTPILPGESTCRFCGATGEFSVRINKPEIIGFDDIEDNYERIDFTLGEDEVSISPEVKVEPVVMPTMEPTPVIVPVDVPTAAEPTVISTELSEVTPVIPELSPIVEPVVQEVKPVVESTPMVQTVVEPVSIVQSVEPVTEVVNPVVSEVVEQKVPVVNSVIDEPATAKIPVEEVKKIVEASKEEVVDDVVIEPVVEIAPVSEVKNEVVEEKKEETVVEEEPKQTNNYKGFCIVLAIFLAVSVILNCFLLLKTSGDTGVVKASESALVNLKTVYKNYKFSLPYSWVVNGDNEEYLLIHNDSETWAASISLASNLDYSLVDGNEDKISNVFSKNEHVFTSNYVKTVNGKEFHLFKGKYASHTVYLIVNEIDDETVAVTDVKFKGEVDDEVINDILKCLTNVSVVDMNEFSKNEFEFENVAPLLEEVIELKEDE